MSDKPVTVTTNNLLVLIFSKLMQQQLGCFYLMLALLQGKFEDVRVHVVTRHGYRVEAPVGLAFGCYQPGKTDRLSPLSFPQ
jgi:hypothetical protein